ncbi:MAG TPA: hypothetical protein DEA62_02465 [Coxiellaceae bacterium]|nr:hypothetical protein [Coxiellaceae bacterium]
MPKITKGVTITKYPESISSNPNGSTVTFGDMHGNTMKLLWNLIQEGVIKIEPKEFDKMWKAYRENDVEAFISLIGSIEVVRPDLKVRLIGDVFADRGQNDYFTLKVLEKLYQGGVKPEITYSNHDIWLLGDYKKEPESWAAVMFNALPFMGKQAQSGGNLLELIKKGGDPTLESVQGLIDTYVIPFMKVISYSLSEDKSKISLFMHAPNVLDRIKDLAQALEVSWPEEGGPKSAVELARIIDEINSKFDEIRTKNPQDYEKIMSIASDGGKGTTITESSSKIDKIGKIFGQFVWERFEFQGGAIDFGQYPPFVSHVVHGHTTVGPSADPRQIGLDGDLGKFLDPKRIRGELIDFNEGEYLVFQDVERVFEVSLSVELPAAEKSAALPATPSEPPAAPRSAASPVASQPPPSKHQARELSVMKENVRKFINDIKKLEGEANEEADKRKIKEVVTAAEAFLEMYKGNGPIDKQNEHVKALTEAVDNVQGLKISKLSWKNVLNVFFFIPSFINLIKTRGEAFWFRSVIDVGAALKPHEAVLLRSLEQEEQGAALKLSKHKSSQTNKVPNWLKKGVVNEKLPTVLEEPVAKEKITGQAPYNLKP